MLSLDPTTHCPVCTLKYTFIRVRYTLYDEKGEKFDECGPCGIERLSTAPKSDIEKTSYTS